MIQSGIFQHTVSRVCYQIIFIKSSTMSVDIKQDKTHLPLTGVVSVMQWSTVVFSNHYRNKLLVYIPTIMCVLILITISFICHVTEPNHLQYGRGCFYLYLPLEDGNKN